MIGLQFLTLNPGEALYPHTIRPTSNAHVLNSLFSFDDNKPKVMLLQTKFSKQAYTVVFNMCLNLFAEC